MQIMQKMLSIVAVVGTLLAGLSSAETIKYQIGAASSKVYLQYQATTGVGNTIVTAATTTDWIFTIVKNTGVTAGVIAVQVADDEVGPWATIDSVDLAVYTGASVPVQLNGRWHAIRLPITTTISGGSHPRITITAVGK